MEQTKRGNLKPKTAARLAAGVLGILSLVAFQATRQSVDRSVTELFTTQSQNVRDDIEKRLNEYVETLYSGRAFVAGSEAVNRAEFNRFIGILELPVRYPGIQVIGRAERASVNQLDSFAAVVEEDAASSGLGYPTFIPYPETSLTERVVISFIEPQAGNEAAFGLDFLSEPNRRSAVERARDSGQPAATAPITLVQETESQLAFLVMLADYSSAVPPSTVVERRSTFEGLEYVALRMGDLMEGVVSNGARPFSFEVYDLGLSGTADTPDESGLMYSLSGTDYALSGTPGGEKELFLDLEFGGRTWGLFYTTEGFTDNHLTWIYPLAVLMIGLGFTGLAAWLVWATMSKRERAEALAEEKHAAFLRTQEQLSVMELRFHSAFHNSPVAMIIANTSGEILDQNESFKHLTGDLRLDRLDECIANPEAILDAPTASKKQIEFQLTTADQPWVAAQISTLSQADDQMLIQLVDITERRRTQMALETALKQERDAVSRMTELEQVRSDFVATVSHELRTPLTSMEGSLEMLRDSALSELDVNEDDLYDIMQRAIDRLQSNVENLLDFSRFEAGDIEFSPERISVDALLSEAVDSIAQVADINGVEILLNPSDGDVAVVGHRHHLDRALTNLLSNAVKYSSSGGSVAISMTASHDLVTVEVRDSGMGISAEDQENLFGRYFRSSAANVRSIQGTGLGLFIVKQIVDQHGGSVNLTSDLGVGTTVSLTLPRAMDHALNPTR